MKRAQQRKKKLEILATVLLLLAIPISLIGVEQVNDIRNRASEPESPISFLTDFTDPEIKYAYRGVRYQHTIEIGGAYSPISSLQIGCDTAICGEICTGNGHTAPEELIIAEDNRTIIWDNPREEEGLDEWTIPLLATAPDPDQPDAFLCKYTSYTLTLLQQKENEPPICSLHSPNPLTNVPEGIELSFILEGLDLESGISSASVTFTQQGTDPQELLWTLPDNPQAVVINKDSTQPLTFIPEETGSYSIAAEMTDTEGLKTECDIPGGAGLNVVIPGENGSPTFTSDPYTDSRPSTSVTIGQSYSYTVTAEDAEDDNMDYFVINNTGWLNFSVTDNSPGSFTGSFSGTPTAAGSYTVAIALNDGMHNHYTTQIWVINVDSPTNDTPRVRVVLPEGGSRLEQGQTTKIQWEATDNNLITKFDVYLAADPTNNETWNPLITDLGYNYDSYMWNTGTTPIGTYYIVVEATDNQSPAAKGTGISGAIGVGMEPTGSPEPVTPEPEPEEPEPEPEEPEITESYPKIINLTPEDQSETDDPQPLISAEIAASDGETLNGEEISISIDDTDITALAIIRGKNEEDGSVIYTPNQPMSFGSHSVRISIEDSSGKATSKSWTFTILGEETEPESDEDTISILGFTIQKRIAVIIGIGLILILFALTIPWMFYASWRRSRTEEADIRSYETFDQQSSPPLTDTSINPVEPSSYTPETEGIPISEPSEPETAPESPDEPTPTSLSPDEEISPPAAEGIPPQQPQEAPPQELVEQPPEPQPDLTPGPSTVPESSGELLPSQTTDEPTLTQPTPQEPAPLPPTPSTEALQEPGLATPTTAPPGEDTATFQQAPPAEGSASGEEASDEEKQLLDALQQIKAEEDATTAEAGEPEPGQPPQQEQTSDVSTTKPPLFPSDIPANNGADPSDQPPDTSQSAPPIAP